MKFRRLILMVEVGWEARGRAVSLELPKIDSRKLSTSGIKILV